MYMYGKQAKMNREELGCIASFFIDGADLLAKEEINDLVNKAKHFAKDRSFKIIFALVHTHASSEGHMLLL